MLTIRKHDTYALPTWATSFSRCARAELIPTEIYIPIVLGSAGSGNRLKSPIGAARVPAITERYCNFVRNRKYIYTDLYIYTHTFFRWGLHITPQPPQHPFHSTRALSHHS